MPLGRGEINPQEGTGGLIHGDNSLIERHTASTPSLMAERMVSKLISLLRDHPDPLTELLCHLVQRLGKTRPAPRTRRQTACA